MPNISWVEILLLLLVAAVTVYPLYGIVDALRQPDDAWRRARQWRWLWVILQILLNFVGTTYYLFVIKREMKTLA